MTSKHRIRTIIAAGAIVGVTAVSLAVWAAPVARGGGAGQAAGHHGILQRLLSDPEIREQAEITDDQAEVIESATYEARESMIRSRSEAELARLELQRLWSADEPDADAIHEVIDRLGEIHTAQQHAAADLRLLVDSTLTQDQRDAAREVMRERFEERREVRGARRGGLRGQARERFGGPGPAAGPGQGHGPRRSGPGSFGQGPQGPFADFEPGAEPFPVTLAGDLAPLD